MHAHRLSPLVRIALGGSLALLALAGAGRADVHQDLAALWDDPTFQKQFFGSYGINADIEPRLTNEDLKVLEKVRPLMGKDLAAAEALLMKAIKPESSAILDFDLGNVRSQLERTDDALKAYRNAVQKFPSFRRAWRAIGLVEARNGKLDAAIEAFTKMIELGGGDSSSYGALGYAYEAKQDYQAAEVALRNALLLQPENATWRFVLTRCVFKQEKFQDAAALLDVLIERFPERHEFWLLQAQAFLGMKQPLRAAENLEALDLLGKASADSLHTLGDLYSTEGLPDLATRAYLRAIDVDPKQPVARPLRAAEVLAARGALTQARAVSAHLRTAAADTLDENARRKLLKLEARLAMSEGVGTPETAAMLEEVVKLDPLDGEALLLLGQHYERSSEPDRAIFYYERAASLEAFEVHAKIRHAQTLVKLARYADALPLLRSAQELRPREDVARYVEQVERLAKARR